MFDTKFNIEAYNGTGEIILCIYQISFMVATQSCTVCQYHVQKCSNFPWIC